MGGWDHFPGYGLIYRTVSLRYCRRSPWCRWWPASLRVKKVVQWFCPVFSLAQKKKVVFHQGRMDSRHLSVSFKLNTFLSWGSTCHLAALEMVGCVMDGRSPGILQPSLVPRAFFYSSRSQRKHGSASSK